MSSTRQQQRLADRLAKKQSQADARKQLLPSERSGKGDRSVQCPCCGQSIEPKLMDYLPRPDTYKQYRCPKCSSWLTIDFKSRIKLIALGSLGIFATSTGSALLLV